MQNSRAQMILTLRLATDTAILELFPPVEPDKIDQVIEDINSIDDLCEYITSLEQGVAPPDPLGIAKRIYDILAKEER